MPRPGEDRSNVGGAAQFNNIGPVPLSRPRFRDPAIMRAGEVRRAGAVQMTTDNRAPP